MTLRGRPRKHGKRKPSGRLENIKKKDERLETAAYRTRTFQISKALSVNPLAGYLAGVLYLKGKLSAVHLGHFYSFLQLLPHSGIRAIPMSERVQGGRIQGVSFNRGYSRLVKYLGKRVNALHELAHDRLVVPVNTLKHTLELVPLTRGGAGYISWCENHHPRSATKTK